MWANHLVFIALCVFNQLNGQEDYSDSDTNSADDEYARITDGVNKIKFSESIEAIGFPYYKIRLDVGKCNDELLYTENKYFNVSRSNRLIDIYYSSADATVNVSRVEIRMVLNTTECYAFTNTGIGGREFKATVVLPRQVDDIYFNLKIFTCHTSFPSKKKKGRNKSLPKKKNETK